MRWSLLISARPRHVRVYSFMMPRKKGTGAFARELVPVRQERQAVGTAPSWRMTITLVLLAEDAAMAMKTPATRVIRRK